MIERLRRGIRTFDQPHVPVAFPETKEHVPAQFISDIDAADRPLRGRNPRRPCGGDGLARLGDDPDPFSQRTQVETGHAVRPQARFSYLLLLLLDFNDAVRVRLGEPGPHLTKQVLDRRPPLVNDVLGLRGLGRFLRRLFARIP